jgi:ABC-type Fe3+-siderophore transport system permease subunit
MIEGSSHAAVHDAVAAARPIRARLALTVSGFGLLTVMTCALAPLVGSTPIDLGRALDPSLPFASNVDAQILFIARLPRVLAGALVGAALASSGVVFQALLRNPLATPFTLGVSAGASLGAMLVIILGGTIAGSLPLILASGAIFAVLPSSLNLLGVDADSASARGVDVAATQRWAFVSASMATSAAVALAGPIGFVGIVVPHLVRLLVGVDHRIVLPASALFGASFLVACDLVARTLLAPVEMPVGVVTAIIGGPFFLWLLVREN